MLDVMLDRGRIVGHCDICESQMYEDSAFCPECNEVPCYLICETCWGTGELVDNLRINPTTIDVPYKTCPDCNGSKRKVYW